MKGELLGFTLGNHHSSEFGLVRTTKGMSSKELFGKFQDSTQTIQGSDITLFHNSYFQSKNISMQTAFTNLNESELQRMKVIWNKNQMYSLVFDESPHKYFMVKIDKITSLKHLAFENSSGRYYNGEVTFSFISYFPYAISRFEDESEAINQLTNEYKGYWENLKELPLNKPQINTSTNPSILEIYNYGDLPAIFKIWLNVILPEHSNYRIKFDLEITARSQSSNTMLSLNGFLKDVDLPDYKICIDNFRNTIMGYLDTNKCTNILYTGTMTGEYLILPPKEVVYIEFNLKGAKAYKEDGTIDETITVNFVDFCPEYEIQYIYRE